MQSSPPTKADLKAQGGTKVPPEVHGVVAVLRLPFYTLPMRLRCTGNDVACSALHGIFIDMDG